MQSGLVYAQTLLLLEIAKNSEKIEQSPQASLSSINWRICKNYHLFSHCQKNHLLGTLLPNQPMLPGGYMKTRKTGT
jgi:hypothetical protein